MSIRSSRYSIILPGGGPWRILDECPATFHNTQSAADRKDRWSHAFCICPRALELKAQGLIRKRALNKAAWQRRQAKKAAPSRAEFASTKVPTMRRVREVPVPDMTNAACSTARGQVIMERAFMRSDVWNDTRARELCNGTDVSSACPMRAQCAAWVLGAEVIPGSWGGVYGGLTAKDRKRVAA